MARTKGKAAAGGSKKPRQTAAELAPLILEELPAKAAEVARALDRKPSDGTVRRALANLVETGAAERDEDKVFKRCQELPTLAAPRGADDEARELHASLLKVCQEQGTWRDHDIHLLNDLVRRDQQAREFEDEIKGLPFTVAESGRIYAHPGIDKARDARRDVQTLRDALVLTPDARKKHGQSDGGEEGDGDAFDF